MNPFFPSRRVVAIGGGTGLSTLLRGLKHRVRSKASSDNDAVHSQRRSISNLTAVVAVTDDGGSSGRLRHDFNILPPGDLRNCMVALAEDEQLFSQLFRHRFCAKGELDGHSFGNLFIAALSEITGDSFEAIKIASEVLAIRGRILPSTSTNATLVARMKDGSVIRGETNINASELRIAKVTLEPTGAPALPETLEVIADADLVTIGPGSLYTSLVTNLLVGGIPEALAATQATRVYIANLMTEANESLGMSVADHIECIYQHAGRPIFDYALVNTGAIPSALLEQYASEGAEPADVDFERIEAMDIRCITGDLIAQGETLRHAPDRLADALLRIPCACLPLDINPKWHVHEAFSYLNYVSDLHEQEGAIPNFQED